MIAIAYLVAVVVLAVLVLRITDRLRVRRPTAEQAARDEALRRARLLDTDWAGLERDLGHVVPARLRELYADVATVTATDLVIVDPTRTAARVEWDIGCFERLAPIALGDSAAPVSTVLHFASSVTGDPYTVDVSAAADGDGPVHITYHDGGERELVAERLSVFLDWPRERHSAVN